MEDVFDLNKGGAVFVNTNAIHTVRAMDPYEKTVLYTLFFDADFITGGYGNLFSRKYVEPVAVCRNLFWQQFRMETPEGVRMLARLLEIIELFQEEPAGYEFQVRATLCNLWLDLLKDADIPRRRL